MNRFPWVLLPDRIGEIVLALSLRDQIFLLVAVSIAVLVVFSLMFAVWTLLHRTWAERRAARRRRLKEKLEPWILDCLAGDGSPDEVWRRIPEKADDLFVALVLEYAERLRGEDLERARRLASPHLDSVVRQIRDPTPEKRAWAVRSLRTLGPHEHREELRIALDDPVPLVALLAARALTETRDPEWVRPILDRLGRFELWSPRYVAEMVATVGPEAVPEIRELYLDPEAAPSVRTVAAEALRSIASPEGADMASEVLEAGAPDDVVAASLRILTDVGRGEHLPLVRSFVDDPRPVVRALAVTALGILGSEEDARIPARRLEDPSRWVALHAARALRDLGATEALEARREDEDDLGELAREVLGRGAP